MDYAGTFNTVTDSSLTSISAAKQSKETSSDSENEGAE
jgi:hypothetical protein